MGASQPATACARRRTGVTATPGATLKDADRTEVDRDVVATLESGLVQNRNLHVPIRPRQESFGELRHRHVLAGDESIARWETGPWIRGTRRRTFDTSRAAGWVGFCKPRFLRSRERI